MPANELKITWVDEDGKTSTSKWLTDEVALAPLAGLIAALKAVSKARMNKVGILRTGVPAVAIPSEGGAYDVADKVIIECLDTGGNLVKIAIPAPDPNLLPDSDNVDLTLPNVVSWFAAAQAVIETVHGFTLASMQRGYRIRSTRANN